MRTSGKIVMFADDAQLIYDGYLNEEETIERQINEDIVAMKNFLQSLHMKLNEAKTVVTRFATPRQLLRIDPDKTFSLGDCDVVISSESRNLGLIIDTATTFRPHFLKISKECSLTLYHLKAIRSFIPDKQTKLLVESLIVSKVRTYLPITITATAKNIEILQKVVNHCIRVLHKRRKFDCLSDVRNLYNWGTMRNLCEAELKKVVLKVVAAECSAYLNNLLSLTNHGRTRQRLYEIDPSNTTYGEKRFKQRASVVLNRFLSMWSIVWRCCTYRRPRLLWSTE